MAWPLPPLVGAAATTRAPAWRATVGGARRSSRRRPRRPRRRGRPPRTGPVRRRHGSTGTIGPMVAASLRAGMHTDDPAALLGRRPARRRRRPRGAGSTARPCPWSARSRLVHAPSSLTGRRGVGGAMPGHGGPPGVAARREPGRGPRETACVERPALTDGSRLVHNGGHHPERLRDGPCDAAATRALRPPSRSAGARCQCPSDEEDAVDFVSGLRCRECGRPYPAEALHVCDFCFGPLEVTYDYDGCAADDHPRARSRPGPDRSGATPTCCRCRTRRPVDLGAGFTPAGPGRPPGGRARPRRAVDQGRHRQPDRLVQGPGGVGGADQGPPARVQGRRLRLDRQPGQLGGRPRGAGRHGVGRASSPTTSKQAKVIMTSVYGGQVVAVEGSYDDVNRLCAELTSEHPSWAFVNVNVRTYYAEGSKTLAFEVAEQLGWQAPDHVVVPIGVGQPADQGGQGVRRAVHRSACSTRSRTCGCRAPRRRGARRWPRRSPREPTPSGR